jgi:hypothetical protein
MNKEPKVEQEPSAGARLDTGTSSTRAYDRRPGKLSTKSKNHGKKTTKTSSRQSVFALDPS